MTQEMIWPEDYYRQLDGVRRLALLDEYAPDTPEEDARRAIWRARYEGTDATDGSYDYFIKAWLDLAVLSRKSSLFGAAKQKTRVEHAAQVLLLDRYPREDETMRRLLDAEYLHLFRMIIHLESTDYGFSHHVLGIGRLDNEALRNKLGGQIERAVSELPKKHDLQSLFSPLRAAADAALAASFERPRPAETADKTGKEKP